MELEISFSVRIKLIVQNRINFYHKCYGIIL